MTAPKISPAISMGNAINFLAVVLAVGIGWGELRQANISRDEATREIKELIRSEVETRRANVGALEARVRGLEASQARTDERTLAQYQSLLAALGRIEAQNSTIFERLKRRMDQLEQQL